MKQATLDTDIGALTLTEEAGAIVRCRFCADAGHAETPLLREAVSQLTAYFAGQLEQFDLPLRPSGTPLELAVYDQMSAIPFGRTLTYGDVARAVDAKPQVVGQACGANPLPVLIPCHRILGATSLGGYSGAGGVETKVALLRLEGAAGLLI